MGFIDAGPKTARDAKRQFYGLMTGGVAFLVAAVAATLAQGDLAAPAWFLYAFGAGFLLGSVTLRVEYRLLALVEDLRAELSRRPA